MTQIKTKQSGKKNGLGKERQKFKNTFAPMVDDEYLTVPCVIQLLKVPMIQFRNLPEEVQKAVEDYFEEREQLEAADRCVARNQDNHGWESRYGTTSFSRVVNDILENGLR